MNASLALILTPAGAAIVVSAVFAIVAVGMMVVLYLRRRLDERQAAVDRDGDLALSRQLLAIIANSALLDSARLPPTVSDDQRRRVFSHLLHLVRGQDQDRLLALADAMALPEAALADLRDRRPARRVDAMRVLEQFPVPRAIDALIERMGNDPDDAVRLEAAAALARTGHLPPPAAVIEMLGLRHRPLNRLHEAIFRTSAHEHAAGLAALARDPSLQRVRSLIVEALGWSNDFSTLRLLAQHANDADPQVRSAALRAARKLGHPDVETWVLPLLLDPVDVVRTNAARTCGALGLRDAIPVLATLLENPSWWVRTRAAEALAMLRPAQPSPLGPTGLRR